MIESVDGLPGAPWSRPLRGELEQLTVVSEVLEGNPLGDPVRRPLLVYRSPGVVAGTATDVASVYMLQGFSGQAEMWLNRASFEPRVIERIDDLYDPEIAPRCPDAVIVFVDAFTRLGGSQFLNSAGTGRYLDYICDELVAFIDHRYPTDARAARRAVAGKSSGGYGAMVLPMLRPDVFGALASHAGDALFELCYLPDVPKVVKRLRDDFEGSYEVFFESFEAADHFDWARFGGALNLYAMASCYSPDPDRPGEVLLPFDLRTGRLDEEVWALWLACDPVRMAPDHATALRGLRAVHIEAGRQDEFNLDLGAQAFSDELTKLGVEHSFELFDGTHGGISYRYAPTVRRLLQAI